MEKRYSSIMKLKGILDDMAWGYDSFYVSPFEHNYTFGGQIVDMDKYDLVPKQSHYDTLIKQKQEQIDVVDKRLRELKQEKETLLRDSNNRTQNKSG